MSSPYFNETENPSVQHILKIMNESFGSASDKSIDEAASGTIQRPGAAEDDLALFHAYVNKGKKHEDLQSTLAALEDAIKLEYCQLYRVNQLAASNFIDGLQKNKDLSRVLGKDFIVEMNLGSLKTEQVNKFLENNKEKIQPDDWMLTRREYLTKNAMDSGALKTSGKLPSNKKQ